MRYLWRRMVPRPITLSVLLLVAIVALGAPLYDATAGPCVPGTVRSPFQPPCTIGDLTFTSPDPISQSALNSTRSSTKSASRYTITDLGSLGGTQSFAYAINNPGQIVGQSGLQGDTSNHAFLYRKGKMTDLSPLNSGSIQTVGPRGINDGGLVASGVVVGGIYSPALLDIKTGEITVLGSLGGIEGGVAFSGVADSVNNSGQAVGTAFVNDRNSHAFLYSDGAMTDLGAAGGDWSAASGINDHGMIVGAFGFLNGPVHSFSAHAFVYKDGEIIEIDPFGSLNDSSASGVNNKGQVVGSGFTQDPSFLGSVSRGFIYRDGTTTEIGILENGRDSQAFSLNERGQVVGIANVGSVSICSDPSGPHLCTTYIQRAVLYEKGELKDLNSLVPAGSGWDLSWAYGINNSGHITGYGVNNGRFRAFVLTPVKGRSRHDAEEDEQDDQD